METFVREEGQALLNFAFLLVGGQPDDAQDLLQTVLARLVARGISDLEDAKTYACRALVNEHRSIGRRAKTQLRLLERLATQPRKVDRTDSGDRESVLDALSHLTVRQRAAVVLRYYEDMADDEIAGVLGASRSTVRSLIHRAMPTLRAELAASRMTTGPNHAQEG